MMVFQTSTYPSRRRGGVFAFAVKNTMVKPILTFVANNVAADITEYTPECVVYLIAFGTGDPEADGHCWTFSRSFDDDWGVCTVKEIQQATIYDGIERFKLHRSGVECVFELKAAEKTGFRELRVSFAVDDKTWQSVAATSRMRFPRLSLLHTRGVAANQSLQLTGGLSRRKVVEVALAPATELCIYVALVQVAER